MILATHAIVGVAVASFFSDKPIFAFIVAFASHFLLDAIPHWEYSIRSSFINPKVSGQFKFNRAFLLDALTIGSDAVIGFVLAWSIFAGIIPFMIILIGVIGGILPDPLQMVFTRLRFEPLKSIQRFHARIQIKSPVYKDNPAMGIILQVVFIAVVVAIARLVIN